MLSTQLRRSAIASTAALALTGSAAGCGQDPIYQSSNRGSGSLIATTTVENAYIVPEHIPGRCAIQLNSGAAMRFTITNNRQVDTERLLGISTSAAQTARIVPNVDIPPNSTVSFGEPSAQPLDDDRPRPAVRLAQLDPDLHPGKSADVTSKFEQAGNLTLPVPLEACPVQTQ